MAQIFENAGFIEQRSEGHCSTSTVSHCTLTKIRSYFQEGIVPSPPNSQMEWDRCERDEWPWHPYDKTAWIASKMKEDRFIIRDITYNANVQMDADSLQAWKEKDRKEVEER